MHDHVATGISSRDADSPKPLQFSATLLPHRSLSRKGFVRLMLAIGVVSIICGVGFFIVGAWPVTGFFGLDVLLIYLAFRMNYRSARIHERVDLTETELKVTRVHKSGRSQSFAFNPYWVRFQLIRRDDTAHELMLSSHGRYLIFGKFLSNTEKESFADALSAALRAQKSRASPAL